MNPYKLFPAIGVGLVSALALATSFYTISQNEVGVVTRLGKVVSESSAGGHFKTPFIEGVEIYKTDIQAQTPSDRINTYTIDNQEVDVLFTTFYRIPAANAAFIYESNRDYSSRLYSLTIDRLKVAMGQVNVQSVAEKRGELRDVIKATLAHDAQPLGLEIVDFQLTDLQYTAAYRAAINAAAVAKANVEAAEYGRQQAEKNAQLAIVQAQGAATASVATAKGAADSRALQAQAEAQAIRVQGEAQAAAIDAQTKALSSNAALVELRKAERWDGKLPQAIYAGAPIPFMNIK